MVSESSGVGSGGDGGSDGDGGKTLGGKVLSLGSLDSGLVDGDDGTVGMCHEGGSIGGGIRVGSAGVHAMVVGVRVSSTVGVGVGIGTVVGESAVGTIGVSSISVVRKGIQGKGTLGGKVGGLSGGDRGGLGRGDSAIGIRHKRH